MMNKKTFLFMTRFFLITAITLGLSFGGSMAGLAATADEAAASVQVEHAWARPAIVGGNGAVYFKLYNDSDTAVTLIGAEADVAHVVEVHQTALLTEDEGQGHHDDHHGHGHDHGHHDHHDHGHHAHHGHDHHGDGAGVFVMLPVESLEITPQEQVAFEPAGYHIMLIDLTQTLAWDDAFSLTLYFEEIPPVTVRVTVGDEPGA